MKSTRAMGTLLASVLSLSSMTFGASVNDGAFINAPKGELQPEVDVPSTNSGGSATGFRILFIGDSITQHGFNSTTIEWGWDYVAGMAASAEANDYAHLLGAALQERLPDRDIEIYVHSSGGGGSASNRLSAIGDVLGIEPHLVVVQLGEHEHEATGEAALRSSYVQLISAFDGQNPTPLVLCTGIWGPGDGSVTSYSGWIATVERVMSEECFAKGIPFASVEQYALDPACSGTGGLAGVQRHPNDRGHLGYATELVGLFDAATSDE